MRWFDWQLPINSQYFRNCSARQIYACSTEAETNQKAVQHCEKMPRSSVGLDPNRYSNRYPFGPLAVHPLMQRVSGRPKLQVGASNRSFLSLKTKAPTEQKDFAAERYQASVSQSKVIREYIP